MVCFGQGSKLTGRIVTGETALSNVYILNVTQGTEVRSSGGDFSIAAKPGDKIIVHHPKITRREFVLKEDSFKQQPYIISVNVTGYDLDELVIDQSAITEESLGLVPEGQPDLTPAERKLQAASKFTPGLVMPLDPLMNAISGRTKMLKKALASEKKEFLLDKAGSLYSESDIKKELKIPETYTEGFLFYVVEDADFAHAVNVDKDDEKAKDIMKQLAVSYIDKMYAKE